MFDYYCCNLVVPVHECSISLDSDFGHLGVSRRSWFTRCFRFNYVRHLQRNILTSSGKNYGAINAVKGDLFVILGACCYGLSNVLEEFLVSKRPLYEVVGQVLSASKCVNESSGSLECLSWEFNALFLSENLLPTQRGVVLLLDTSWDIH